MSTRHALLIGIDKYPFFSDDSQLRGCVNDADLMSEVLRERFGFTRIRRLSDREATRDGILEALKTLSEEVRTGDTVVLSYSGHGSRRTNAAAPDGYDETIVPHDSGRGTAENRDIRDSEIASWLHEVSSKTPFVLLVFDSCHSGSITRDPLNARIRAVEPDTRPFEARPVGTRGPSGALPVRERYAVIAACRSHEPACELRYNEAGRPQGALTYFLCQELRHARPGESYLDVFERLAPRITADYPVQHPQLEGALHRELLGTRTFEAMSFVPVVARTNSHVTLGAGAAHGLRTGCEWLVYPPGTRQGDGQPPVGRVYLGSPPGAVEARAEIRDETTEGAVAPGARAVEAVHDQGELAWSVEVRRPGGSPDAPARVEALKERIAEAPLLRCTGPGEAGRVRVLLETSAGELVWNVVDGTTGRRLLTPQPSEHAPERLVEALERHARYHLTLGLANPHGDLAGRVQMELLRRTGSGSWTIAKREPGGDVVFEEGDHLGIRVRQLSEKAMFLSVLDFGVTFGVDVLFPFPGTRKALAPGAELEIGTRPGDEIELFLPQGYAEREGVEHMKLFATTQEADFSSLKQEGVHRRARSALERLLRKSLTGFGPRDARRVPASEWATVSRRFLLRRR